MDQNKTTVCSIFERSLCNYIGKGKATWTKIRSKLPLKATGATRKSYTSLYVKDSSII